MAAMRSFEGAPSRVPTKTGPKLSWPRRLEKELVVWRRRTEKERRCGREVMAREGGSLGLWWKKESLEEGEKRETSKEKGRWSH